MIVITATAWTLFFTRVGRTPVERLARTVGRARRAELEAAVREIEPLRPAPDTGATP